MTHYPINDEALPRQEFATTCPGCQRELQMPGECEGKAVACPFCNHNFTAQPGASTELGRAVETQTRDVYRVLNLFAGILIILGVLATFGGFVKIFTDHANCPEYNWWSDGLWIMFSGVFFLVDAGMLKLLGIIAQKLEQLAIPKQ